MRKIKEKVHTSPTVTILISDGPLHFSNKKVPTTKYFALDIGQFTNAKMMNALINLAKSEWEKQQSK